MATAEQQRLVEEIERLLKAEPRVEAAWLAGSLGAGAGDAFSDVDVLALAVDGAMDEVSAAVAAKLPTIARPALVNSLFGGRVLNVVTDAWERFDISLVQAEDLARYDAAALTPLFNRGDRTPPTQPDRPYRTAPDQLLKIVNEFLRVLGLLPVVVGREEYALALSGVDHLRRMTFDLMLEENGIAPWKRGGALHRNPLLTADQKAQLEALPPQTARRDSVIEAHLAFAALFLPRARRLAFEIGMAWPEDFESATRRHLKSKLQSEF
jgi:predicted nucleotidyltransferase